MEALAEQPVDGVKPVVLVHHRRALVPGGRTGVRHIIGPDRKHRSEHARGGARVARAGARLVEGGARVVRGWHDVTGCGHSPASDRTHRPEGARVVRGWHEGGMRLARDMDTASDRNQSTRDGAG